MAVGLSNDGRHTRRISTQAARGRNTGELGDEGEEDRKVGAARQEALSRDSGFSLVQEKEPKK